MNLAKKLRIILKAGLVASSAHAYNPYGGRTECTTDNGGSAGNGGATLITDVGMSSFCIENTIRSLAVQSSAVTTCAALGGKWGLCRQKEVTAACYFGYRSSTSNSISQSIVQNYHWTADLYDGTNGLLVGPNGCTTVNVITTAGWNGFRCCLR